jgi:hypothetical protein
MAATFKAATRMEALEEAAVAVEVANQVVEAPRLVKALVELELLVRDLTVAQEDRTKIYTELYLKAAEATAAEQVVLMEQA